MFVAEVGLNHNGDIEYAREYLNFFKNSKIDGLTFQIREPVFYTNVKKSHFSLKVRYFHDKSLTLVQSHVHLYKSNQLSRKVHDFGGKSH